MSAGAKHELITERSEIIRKHMTLEVVSIDRMYLNVYQPQLQRDLGVVGFFRYHRGQPLSLRVALFYTRTYVSVMRPGLSQIVSVQPPGDKRLRSHFEKTTEAVEQWCRNAKLAA